MPIPHSLGKQYSTPLDIEEVKQYKDQETFIANNITYVKVQIMLVEKMTFKREKMSVNYEAVKFIN